MREKTAEVVDDHTCKIHMESPAPHLDWWVGNQGRNMIIEIKARWDAIGHEGYGDATVGTGHMLFVERIEEVHVLLEALDEQYRKVPEFKELPC